VEELAEKSIDVLEIDVATVFSSYLDILVGPLAEQLDLGESSHGGCDLAVDGREGERVGMGVWREKRREEKRREVRDESSGGSGDRESEIVHSLLAPLLRWL